MSEGIKSPCTNICKYDEDSICIGCFRTMDEITGWIFMSEARKKQALEEASQRKQTPKPGKYDYEHYV